MKAIASTLVAGLALAGCANSETRVLEPYTLANGRVLQDVVTVAAHPTGGAPVVTSVATYDVSATGGGRRVGGASGAAPGPGLALANGVGAALGAAAGASAAVLVADAVGTGGDTVNAVYNTSGNVSNGAGDAGDIDAVTGVLRSSSVNN